MQRLKNNEREDHSRHTAGCPKRTILRVIFLLKISRDIRYDNGHEVQGYKIKSSGFSKQAGKNRFDKRPEKVKGKHIVEKVYVVDVDKPRGEEAVVLPVSFDPVGIHHQSLHHSFFAHRHQADQYSKSDDSVSDVHSLF